jgi:hypothetical protein
MKLSQLRYYMYHCTIKHFKVTVFVTVTSTIALYLQARLGAYP